jgi:hypothetical protein
VLRNQTSYLWTSPSGPDRDGPLTTLCYCLPFLVPEKRRTIPSEQRRCCRAGAPQSAVRPRILVLGSTVSEGRVIPHFQTRMRRVARVVYLAYLRDTAGWAIDERI